MSVFSSLGMGLRFKYFLIFFAIGIIPDLNAQTIHPYEIVDRHCDCPEFWFDGKPGFNLKPIDSSDNNIEIRLNIYPDHHGTRIMIVLKKSMNVSSGNYYFKKGMSFGSSWPDSAKGLRYWEPNPFWKFNISTIDVGSVIENVMEQNLASLKSQKEFYKGQGYYTPYSITYKVGKKIGNFSFGNPDDFLKENPGIDAFRKYKAILNALLPLVATYYRTVSQYPRQ